MVKLKNKLIDRSINFYVFYHINLGKIKMKNSIATKIKLATCTLALPTLLSTNITFANNIELSALKQRAEILNTTYAHISARALHIAAYYKIFDMIDKKGSYAQELAKKLKFNDKNLEGLLMVLANHGILEKSSDGKYSLNEKSKILVSTANNSLQPAIAKEYDNRRWSSIGRVDIAIVEGRNPFEALYNETFYEYLSNNKAAADLFNKGMTNFSGKENKEIPSLYNFGKFKTICDVGGSDGSLINEILTKYQNVNGSVLDLKSAIKESNILKNNKFGNRLSGIEGDFFNSIPAADAIILKRVIHNWSNEDCIKILKNCVLAINETNLGRIFIIEKVMPSTPDGSLLIDTSLGGIALGGYHERSISEFNELAKSAGLELEKNLDTKTGISVMVFKIKS